MAGTQRLLDKDADFISIIATYVQAQWKSVVKYYEILKVCTTRNELIHFHAKNVFQLQTDDLQQPVCFGVGQAFAADLLLY